jgi:hypothetical protein
MLDQGHMFRVRIAFGPQQRKLTRNVASLSAKLLAVLDAIPAKRRSRREESAQVFEFRPRVGRQTALHDGGRFAVIARVEKLHRKNSVRSEIRCTKIADPGREVIPRNR